MKFKPGEIVHCGSGRPILYDEKWNQVNPKKISPELMVRDIAVREEDRRGRDGCVEYTLIVMTASGLVVQTKPVIHWQRALHVNQVYGKAYLQPEVRLDLVVEELFDVGYVEVAIGSGHYGRSFGISCRYEPGKEPRYNNWPYVWKLAVRLEVRRRERAFRRLRRASQLPADSVPSLGLGFRSAQAMTEEELEFKEVRQFSPQWEVLCKGVVVARVTERYIASPSYSVIRIVDGEDKEETFVEDREKVIETILRKAKDGSA